MSAWSPRLPAGGPSSAKLTPFLFGGVAVAAFIGLWWFYSQQLDQLSTQLRLSGEQVAELKAQNDQIMRQLAGAQSERKALDDRLASLRAELSDATGDLERSRTAFEDLQARLREFGEERTDLRAQVEALTAARQHDQELAASLEQRKSELEQSVGRLRERLSLLDRDYRVAAKQLEDARLTPHPGVDIVSSYGPSTSGGNQTDAPRAAVPASLVPGTVELPPIIVRKDQAGMAVPVRGRLVEVNDAHAFVVVDKGTLDGVYVGMGLELVRGSETVGRATVVRVRPQLSAADVVRQHTPGPLQVGDQAIQRGP